MGHIGFRRIGAALAAGALALLLAACFVLPGKFVSTLDIRKDGRFTYTYKGEIILLGLTKIAQEAMKAKDQSKFELQPCYKEDAETERKCTPAEAAEQKADWQKAQTEAAAKRDRDLATFKKVFGGIDPNDPRAADEIADRLRHQAGWNSVVYKGNGIYIVDVTIGGMLDRDFEFPSIERMPGMYPFLVANRRSNGEIRIDSPLMQAVSYGSPLGSAAQVYTQEMSTAADKETWADFVQVDGHFTITTDGNILSNNTEHGPKAAAGGKQLDWDISGHNPVAPMAVIAVGN